jgi:IMP dehydrogenase
MQDRLLGFDDVLIEPVFSNVRSRKDVNLATEFLGQKVSLPVINSNMDTVASPALCWALAEYGTIGSLHRFWSIEENIEAYKNSQYLGHKPIVSIGIGEKEIERAARLVDIGAEILMLDVAHAANIAVVETYATLLRMYPNAKFIVGDFGNVDEFREFRRQTAMFLNDVHYPVPDAIKVGIGIGSVCRTRNVTGVGNTALSCLLEFASIAEEYEMQLILDGGIKEIGDIAKALIAGADMVMSGSLFAGTDEAAGNFVTNTVGKYKEYRGSASHESYVVQDKVASWRAAEGTSILVPYKGPVKNVLDTINGGLRSSCSYVNAFNLDELKANGKFNFRKELV